MNTTILSPNTVVMVQPVQFGFNEEAFETNKFQQRENSFSENEVQKKALYEFNTFVDALRNLKVTVLVFEDSKGTFTPDSIFPNNWFSTHQNGMIVTYPMLPKNRRLERREDIIESLVNSFNYSKRINLEDYEQNQEPKFLEGTGSIVFNHQAKTIYAALSPRTNDEVLKNLADKIDYKVVSFFAYGSKQELIYHTNVMMCIGETFVLIGAETINASEREMVLTSLKEEGKAIIELTNNQVYNHFAGNMLQLRNTNNETILVMSEAAYNSLTEEQLALLNQHNDHLLHVPLTTIEKVGGGSARCMLAEVNIPQKFAIN